jgi:hypothetical protein
MITTQRLLHSERGMILLASLLILSLLMAVGVGSVISVQNEFRITGNLKTGTSALYLAEAGIEWGKEQIGNATTNPPVLADATREFSSGNFSVSVLSSTLVSPLSGQVTMRSNGTLGGSSQTVQVQVTKVYDLADGALALRGNSRRVNFGVNSFYISGLDYDPITGTAVPGAKVRPGITLGSPALLGQVENGLNSSQKSQIVGSDGGGAAISLTDRLPGDVLVRLANDLCAASNAQISSVPPAGNLSLSNQVWGNRAAPQLHCINGIAQSAGDVVTGENFSGAGILIVKDAGLVASGVFHWEGLIIVTGNDVGFRISGEESKEIIGAVMINETGAAAGAGDALLDIQGSVRILYSRFTLRIAASLIPTATLTNTYARLPFYVKQDYWRSMTP